LSLPGQLGDYEPLLELASGGMATVYLARHVGAQGFERLVVIKRVHRHLIGNREFSDMFIDEARVAALIRHPNVVPVINVVETGGELFLVMDYVESVSLSSLLNAHTKLYGNDHGAPPRIAARIMADSLAGLHAAHEATDMRGVPLSLVHRDVSPQNIIVGTDGTSRLIDFGIARAATRLSETKTGSLKGKIAYMAPEQAQGGAVDRRVDVFASGVTLHEALVGKRLFRGENDLDTLRRILESPIPAPSDLVPDIPRALDDVVFRALERNPHARFATAADFLDALERAITPATPREVASFLRDNCGERLLARTGELHRVLEETGSRPQVVLPRPQRTEQNLEVTAREIPLPPRSSNPQIGAEGSGSIPRARSWTSPVIEAPGVGMPVTAVSSPVIVGPTESIHTALATASEVTRMPAPPRRQSGALVALAAAMSVIAVGAGAAVILLMRSPQSRAQSARGTANDASVTVVSTEPEIELVLSADAPIEKVHAPGAKRIELEGGRAHVFLSHIEDVEIFDAELADGSKAHGEATRTGPRTIRLKTAAPPAPPPPTVIRPTRPPQTPPPVRPTAKPELQDNPYGGH